MAALVAGLPEDSATKVALSDNPERAAFGHTNTLLVGVFNQLEKLNYTQLASKSKKKPKPPQFVPSPGEGRTPKGKGLAQANAFVMARLQEEKE